MGIGYAVGNVLLAARAYENWAEVIADTVTGQRSKRVVLKNGLTIEAEVGLRSLVREIFFERVYNPAYLPIGDNDVVVDIGANGGVFTLFAASITQNVVHAFEPSPRNLAVLRRNVAVNGLHRVTSHGCAVSDKVGSAKLILSAADGQHNLLSDRILPEKIGQYKNLANLNSLISQSDKAGASIEVPTTTLQEIMDSNDLEQIDFLKLDCEGAEGPILQSTPMTHLKRVRKMAMEFHDHLLEFGHSDIQSFLEGAGFHTRLKWDGRSPLGYLYAWRS